MRTRRISHESDRSARAHPPEWALRAGLAVAQPVAPVPGRPEPQPWTQSRALRLEHHLDGAVLLLLEHRVGIRRRVELGARILQAKQRMG